MQYSEFERTFPSVVCVSSTSIFNSSSTASLCAVNTKSGFCGLVAVKCFCGSSAFSFGDCSVSCLQALEPLEQAVALSVVAVNKSEQVAVSVPFERKSVVQKQIPRYFLRE